MSVPLAPADLTSLLQALQQAALANGFQVEEFGRIGNWPLLAFTRPLAPIGVPRVYLSAGIHGDEPAPPRTLLRLLHEGFFDGRCSWHICPMLNPVGSHAGKRENGEGIDLNRDYKSRLAPESRAHIAWLERQPRFDLNLCVHEDWESTGYYLYELNPTGRPTLANVMIEAAEKLGPIEEASVIDGRPIDERGIIRPVSDPQLREQWPEAIYLNTNHGTLHYTLESPSARPLAQRIDTHCAVIRRALEVFLGSRR